NDSRHIPKFKQALSRFCSGDYIQEFLKTFRLRSRALDTFTVFERNPGLAESGTFARNSFNHSPASASLGARQSPRGDKDPPEPTFGPFGIAERLNWLVLKKRCRKTRIHFLMVARSYSPLLF